MRELPLSDPGVPDARSPARYLGWLMRGQWRTMAGGMAFGIVWMTSQAVMPGLLGRAIDAGVAAEDGSALLLWAGVIFVVGVLQSVTGIMRHRFAVTNWLGGAYRTVQVVARHAVHLGATLPRRVATGEVVAIGTNDLAHIGNSLDVSARASGAVVSFVVVSVILLQTSVELGLVVLLGMPALLLAMSPLLSPLQRRTMRQRDMMGRLSNLAADIVVGLRVLRGIGGEAVFSRRYGRESQEVRRAGVHVGRLQSVVDSLQVLLPGVFVVVVTWLAVRLALRGEISVGELVAFYGYAAFLVLPLRTVTEFTNKWIRALVAARRVVRVLGLTPEQDEGTRPGPELDSPLVDVASGLRVEPRLLTAVVCEPDAEAARIADRLGRYADGEVRWGEQHLADVARDEVRRRIVVSDTAGSLFSGRLGEQLDLAERGADAVTAALHTAAAADVLAALPEGLASQVAERGRSFSGGQRQRLVLARALALDPEILVLVEPTSAVDAHTEAAIADRLRQARAGRTTVVATSSPLVLDRADVVVLVTDGVCVARGTHRQLLAEDRRYRDVVTRGTDDLVEPGQVPR